MDPIVVHSRHRGGIVPGGAVLPGLHENQTWEHIHYNSIIHKMNYESYSGYVVI